MVRAENSDVLTDNDNVKFICDILRWRQKYEIKTKTNSNETKSLQNSSKRDKLIRFNYFLANDLEKKVVCASEYVFNDK